MSNLISLYFHFWGLIGGVTVSASDYTVGVTDVTFTFGFNLPNAVPIGEKIGITFPNNFLVSSAQVDASAMTVGGVSSSTAFALAPDGNKVILTVSGAQIDAGTISGLALKGITNNAAAPAATFTIERIVGTSISDSGTTIGPKVVGKTRN